MWYTNMGNHSKKKNKKKNQREGGLHCTAEYCLGNEHFFPMKKYTNITN